MKAPFTDGLGDDAGAAFLAWDARPEKPGALSRVGAAESAYPHLAADFVARGRRHH